MNDFEHTLVQIQNTDGREWCYVETTKLFDTPDYNTKAARMI